MVNVVLDTNILVASLLKSNGSSRKALRAVIANTDKFQIVYSSQIFDEYKAVLSRPLIQTRGLSPEATALLELLQEISLPIIPKAIPALVYPDDEDKPFLEAAVYANGILLTNNVKDFPFIGDNFRILQPDEFLAVIKKLK